jgi:hypothetical protein
MSLNVDDWKRVLDQPKNLGLKAGGGTGISALLVKVDQEKAGFNGEKLRGPKPAQDHGALLITALENLIRKCNEVITKHRKLFTTACEYLQKQVVEVANREIRTTREQIAEVVERKDREKAAKTAIDNICHHAQEAIPHVKDIHELITFWGKYKHDLLEKIGAYEHLIGRPGAYKNDIRRMESIAVIEPNAKAFEFLRNMCANEAKLMASVAITPYH